MNKDKSTYIADLRRKAEELLRADREITFNSENFGNIEEILQELEIYQIELEMQNDELKRTREELQTSEEKYFNLYHFAPSSYISIGNDFKITQINKSGLNLFNANPERIIGTDFRKFLPPHSQDEFYFFIRKLNESKSNESGEFAVISGTSKVIDTHFDATLAFNEKKEPIGFNFIVTDISRWKKSISEAKMEEERFRFIQNLPDPVIVHINGLVVFTNLMVENLFGYSSDEVIGRSMLDYVYEEDVQKVVDNMALKQRGLPYKEKYELRLKAKNGDVLTVIVSVTNIEFESKIAEFILIRDITERKEKEEKLRDYSSYHKIKSQLRSITNEQEEEVLLKTFLEGAVREYNFVNAMYLKISGDLLVPEYSYGLSPISINSFFLKVELEKTNDCEYPTIDAEGLISEYSFIDKYNSQILNSQISEKISNTALIPFIIDSKFIGVFLVFSNEKEPSKKKHRLVELCDELRLIVSERRQKEAINKFLIESKDAAETLSRAKTEFLANMSHEIRSPLNPIVGFTNYLLAEFRLPQDVVDILKLIEGSSKKLLKTLSDILDMSKLEFGRMTFSKEEFDIEDFVNELTVPFIQKANLMGYDFIIDVDSQLKRRYYADYLRINQIIANILDNAFKFSYKSNSKIVLSIRKYYDYSSENALDNFDWIEFCVEDEGIGIPDDKKNLIFNIFTQIDSSYSRIYGGTGLGLAIASSIAHCLGGHISFESKENGGSIFKVVLPMYSAKTVNLNFDDIDKNVSSIEKKYKVLVAEDDLANKFLIESILNQAEKYHLEFAKNGEEAVKQFYENPFDVILMDIKMPILDGELATKKIREIEKSKSMKPTPIIGVTAQAAIGSKERYLGAGMNDVIFKPFANNSFLRIIDNHLPKE